MCGFDACAPKMINDIAEANGLSPDTDGRIVFEYIKKENAASWSIFTEYCHKIAKMIVSLQYILDPERFIICGGISTQSLVCEQIMKEVEQIYKKNPMTPIFMARCITSSRNISRKPMSTRSIMRSCVQIAVRS
jgi:predicted NBD/HSP70 family sugar kinase